MRFSVEAFPPKDDKGLIRLQQTVTKIADMGAEFLSITCGAGGSDNDDSSDVIELAKRSGVRFVPHITMSNVSREHLMSRICHYKEQGASGFVALRGDAPAHKEGFRDVTALIGEIASSSQVFCAGYPDPHPESISEEQDMEWMRSKVDAGANEIITQYTFSIDTLCRFRDMITKIEPRIAVRPGVMLIKDLGGALRFSKRAGVPVPASLIDKLDGKMGEDLIKASANLTSDFIRDMVIEGFEAFHVYALNDHRILSRLDGMGALTASRDDGMMAA